MESDSTVNIEKTATNLLGELIRSERKKRHLTLSVLADQTGLSRSYIFLLEKGRVKQPSIRTQEALTRTLGIRDFDFSTQIPEDLNLQAEIRIREIHHVVSNLTDQVVDLERLLSIETYKPRKVLDSAVGIRIAIYDNNTSLADEEMEVFSSAIDNFLQDFLDRRNVIQGLPENYTGS